MTGGLWEGEQKGEFGIEGGRGKGNKNCAKAARRLNCGILRDLAPVVQILFVRLPALLECVNQVLAGRVLIVKSCGHM